MSAPGALLARRPVSADGAGLVPQLALALVCGGYAVGAAFGWGSPRLALFMGDFGLSAAAAHRGRLLLPLRPQLGAAAFARLAAVRPLLRDGGARATPSGAGTRSSWTARCPARLADLFFLCFAPPAIVGLLVLAKRPVTKAGWVCLGLDAWLIGGSLLTLSWSLALAQAAQVEGRASPHTALSLAYPLLDIALVSMVLALHFRRSAVNRSAVNTAIAALALTVLCDALFTSPLLRDNYRSGQLLDAGWFAGSLLLAYAPWVGPTRTHGRRGAHARGYGDVPGPRAGTTGTRAPPGRRSQSVSGQPPHRGSLAALTPYLAAAVCTLGILYNVLDGRSVDRVVLFTGCTVVLALVVRQGIMLSTTSPSPRNWPRRRTTSAPWCRAPATSS